MDSLKKEYTRMTDKKSLVEAVLLIQTFCNSMEELEKEYEWCKEKMSEMDRITQDYLHKLELENLKYDGRAKIATKLTKIRRERREYKDTMMVLEPLYEYMKSDKGHATLNQLRKVQGQVRQADERMRRQTYKPKVLNEEEM